MARNGSGTYSLPEAPVVGGTAIEATWANSTLNDIATALTNSMTKNGETVATANQPMGGFRHTGVGTASLRNQYGVVSQVQDGAYNLAGSISGADTITGSLTPAPTVYASGMLVVFIPADTNTGAATLNLNGVAARSIVKRGSAALVAGDLVAGVPAIVVYDIANTRWVLQVSQTNAIADTTGTLALDRGGTGATTASGARTALELGALALLASVNNDNWSGTDLAVVNGGTGASDASTARTNLGVAIGSNVQAWDADLDAISALAKTDSNFIVGNGTAWVAESGATARTSLGLGSLATISSVNNDNWSGADLAVANGGTGSSTAADARTALGAAADADVVHDTGNETIAGVKTFSSRPQSSSAGGFLSYASATQSGGSITVSTSAPSGTPGAGDLWIQHEA